MLREPHFGEESLPTETPISKDLKILHQIWPFLLTHKAMVSLALASVMIAALAVICLGVGLQLLIDYGFSPAQREWLTATLIGLFVIVFLMAGASFARLYSVSWLAERLVADLRNQIFDHLLTLDLAFFETTPLGDIQSRLMTDTTLVQVVVGTSLPVAIRNLLIILGSLGMLLYTSLALTGWMAFAVPLLLLPVVFLGKRVRHYSKTTQDQTSEVSTRLDETFSFIKTVRAFTQDASMKSRFHTQIEAAREMAMTRVWVRSWMTSLVMLLVFSGICFVLWFGGQAVLREEMTAGQLSSFLFYGMAVAGSLGSLSEIHGDLLRAAGGLDRIAEFMALQPEMKINKKPPPLETVRGEISFQTVSFSYPSRPHRPALSNITLKIHPGEVIALVGPSGAGKSTLFHLMMRFYDPTQGQILFDGVDLRQLNPQDFRSHMALVPQEPALFSTTVYENILFGDPAAQASQVQKAAKEAYAHGFIEDLPARYHTPVGEKGIQLSGGQRQRIAIARALLSDPKILLLDEATSALDTQSEQQVQRALERLMKGKTTLVIAHRLSTVQKADRILVMEEGRILEEGTHDQLLKTSGLYQTLAQLQLAS